MFSMPPSYIDTFRSYEVTRPFRKKALASYFSDCPEVVEELYSETSVIQSVPELYEFCVAQCTP